MEQKKWTYLVLIVITVSSTQANVVKNEQQSPDVYESPPVIPKMEGSCPSAEWFDMGTSTCYLVKKEHGNFQAARESCQQLDPTGRLASIHSKLEVEILSTKLEESASNFWIGLIKDKKSGAFEWLDGTPEDYLDWANGEPSNSQGEDCVELYAHDMKWNDINCLSSNYYICAADKTKPTPVPAICEERQIRRGNKCARSEHGEKCTITCDKNFKKVDDKGRTVLKETDIFCSDGRWDSLPVSCVVQKCEDLMYPRYPNKTWHEFCAEKPNRKCSEKYIEHNQDCACEPGFDEDRNSGNCIAELFCRGIDSPVNGKSDCQRKDIPVKEQCQFSCDQGHALKGKSSLTCKAASYIKAYWDGEPPTCQVNWNGKCEEPTGEHLLVEPGCDRAEKGTCRVYCQPGFQLVDGTKPVPGGKKVLTCTEEYQWGKLPTCRVPACPETFIWNGRACNESVPGGVCTITCNHGHHKVDPRGKRVFEETHVHCKDGTWDPILVACVATFCSDVKGPENPKETWLEHCETKNAGCTNIDGIGPYCFCKPGFEFDDVNNTCVRTVMACDDYDSQSGMIWNKNCARKPFHRCEVDELQGPKCVCELGFKKDWWDSCIRATDFCQGKDNPSNGRSDCHGMEVPFKGQCTFTCNPGYELKGNANLTCVANETATNQRPVWDYHAPTCQKADRFSCADRSTEDSSKSWTQFCRSQNRECVEGEYSVLCGSCLEGFQEDPQNNYTCTVESSSICPDLLAPLGGLLAGACKGASFGEKCLFVCESGKKLVGEGILTCQEKGTWNFKTPTCTGLTVEDCQSIKTGTGMSWKEACERENRACVSDPREGTKCGCQEGLTEICLCTKKRQLLQGFLSYIIEGRNTKYISEIAGPNNKYISEIAGQK